MRIFDPVISTLAAFVAFTAVGCTQLRDIPLGECGNRVVEAEEDCDTFSTSPGARCREPGEVNECRWDCNELDATCPAGFGCGSDGVCRSSSGAFSLTAVTETEFTQFLKLDDFDGDGLDDALLLHPTAASVHYHGASGGIVKKEKMSPAVAPPAAGELTGDKLPDIALVADDEFGFVGVSRARSDRTMSPVSYASIRNEEFIGSVLFAIDALSTDLESELGRPRDEILMLSRSKLRRLDSEGFPVDLQETGEDVDSLLQPIARARVLRAGAYSCEQLALAHCGASSIALRSPCAEDDAGVAYWNEDEGLSLPQIRVQGARVISPAFFADVDGDRRVDLIVGAHVGSDFYQSDCDEDEQPMTGVFVAYGQGDGRFHSTPELAGDEPADDSFALFGEPTFGRLLAAGRIDDDAAVDIVTSQGILMGSVEGGMSSFTAVFPERAGLAPFWARAEIGDFNGNALTDVIAGADDVLKLDFFNGSAQRRLNHFQVPTLGDVDNFVTGDFDGDLLTDIAFVRGIDGFGEDAGLDSIEVMFAQAAGPPEPAVSIAKLPEVVQLVAGNVAGGFDSISDLIALTNDLGAEDDSEMGSNLARFVGSTSRQLQSPLTFDQIFPISVAVGDFDGDGHGDLAVLGDTTDGGNSYSNLLLVPTFDSANVDLRETALSGDLPSELDPYLTLVTPADVDADGQSELLLLGNWSGGQGAGAVIVARFTNDEWQLGEPWLTDLALPFSVYQPLASEAGWDDGAPDYPKADVRDVNGDGDPDLTVLGFASGGRQKIMMVPGNGDGFDFQSAVEFETAREPRSFAFLNADADAALEIAVYDDRDGVVISDFNPETGKLSGGDSVGGVQIGLEVVLLDSGDINGDGVDDLALGTEETIEVYLGVPVR
jgi:hypothetical protein